MTYTTESKIQKWGNGYGVLLPKKIIDQSLFGGEGPITLTFNPQGVSLTPRVKTYTLKEMVAGMPHTTESQLINFGPNIGKEIW
jgi:antitoxin component of MazEF toxin-antitoxin module